MAEDRAGRAAQQAQASNVTRWARALLGVGADPRLRVPRAPRAEPIRRSWLGAFWHARVAVRAGMTLDDFLRSRLARYVAALAVPRARLPLSVEIDEGQIAVRPAATASAAQRADDSWLAPLVALEGPAVRQEVSELEVRLALLEGEIESARQRAQDLSRRLAADVAIGIVVGPPEVNATAEQLGRPPVRSAAPRTLALGFATVALAAETWQVAHPLLRSAGMDPTALRAEAAQRPAELVFSALFALGVAAGLFTLAHCAVAAGLALFRGDVDDRRRRWLAAAAIGSSSLATLVAAAVAALPRAPGAASPASASVLLLVAVALACAILVRGARRFEEQRVQDLAAALAWDRERARALSDRVRRLEELAWAEDEERGLERQRDAVRRRLRELNARAAQAARMTAEAERRDRAALSRVAHSLVAALELDRYEFARQASARGAHELVAPRRRKPPEPVPTFADATPSVAAASAAEVGRLAS